jgi:hypothetical protein
MTGWETDSERRARLEREQLERERLQQVAADRFWMAVSNARSYFSRQPTDCTIELLNTRRRGFSGQDEVVVVRRVAGWNLGSAVSSYDSYGSPRHENYALGQDGVIYAGSGVLDGNRFRSRGSVADANSASEELVQRLRELAPHAEAAPRATSTEKARSPLAEQAVSAELRRLNTAAAFMGTLRAIVKCCGFGNEE